MTRKVTTTKTAEERRQQAAALQASITEKVDTLRNSDQWRAFLDMTRGFHRYSLSNLLLIWSQYPEASRVAGFQQWRGRGRQVRKGEKAIRIFGYATKKVTDDDDDAPDNLTETDESGQRRRVYFPVLSVFDISQTDPIDAGAVDGADLRQTLTGADDLGVLAAATDYLTADGWSVEREPLRAGLGGFTDFKTRRVVIAADVEPAEAAATALHEAAHVLLHGDLAPGEYQQHRGTYETEAESVAYVVAGLLGLDTSAYTIGYVAEWADADTDLIRSTAANVLRAAHTIADAITTQPDDEREAAAA